MLKELTAQTPGPAELIELAPGILWGRLPLPFRLDHVNIYVIRDDDGWVLLDTGVSNRATKAAWEALLEGPLKGERITGLIVTHHHPDHIGLAGWLCDRLEIPLMISRTGYLSAVCLCYSPDLMAASAYSRFYRENGLAPEIAALVSTQGQDYLRMVEKPPFTFTRLEEGQILRIGGRAFHVLTGDGHCAEQVMLWLPEENLFLAADQVIEKITPNVSVMAFEPDGDPLGAFIASLARLAKVIPEDAKVLAGHRQPFTGLPSRCADLIAHHEERLALIMEACGREPQSASDLLPKLYHRALSPHEMSFGFTEILAHMNLLVRRGDLAWETTGDLRRAIRA